MSSNAGPKDPKVTVCVVTYNQEQFIAQCLDSLLHQEVDFPFEIVVGEDCSTDGTRAIVEAYEARYPQVIRAILHRPNVGYLENYHSVHRAARGQYVAHMDGDDYALPGKLASQVRFLDAHPECSIVFHGCTASRPDGQLVPSEKRGAPTTPLNYAEYQWRHPYRHWHSSKMYVRRDELPSYGGRPQIDNHFHFWHGLSGLVGYLNDDLAVYRVGVGISRNFRAIHALAMDSFRWAIELGYDKSTIDRIVARVMFEHGMVLLENRDTEGFREQVTAAFKAGHRSPRALVAYLLAGYPELYLRIRAGMRGARQKLRFAR